MAESSYPDELAAWIEKRATKKRRQDAAAVAFLAVRGDVKAAMDSGYAVTTIYEHMRETGRVKCSYETFRKHVQRFIKQEGGSKPKAPEPKKPEPAGIAGFNFNPKPNKEDLL
ncbi:TraK family protein (plasmid) [Xanthomonas oryzae pv. oryzicola]|uniref:TraK family protein n=1 Tax=Xanthomonas oryzae TaxID=347 RepID=UPI00349EBBEB